jgi:hypothetical protein
MWDRLSSVSFFDPEPLVVAPIDNQTARHRILVYVFDFFLQHLPMANVIAYLYPTLISFA